MQRDTFTDRSRRQYGRAVRRSVHAREIVLIAIMSAITVVGNLLSFSVLPIQAGTGMVIISGIAFGPLAGAAVGMLARFIVNFFTGQGVWTIWQMCSWAILGIIAGIVFARVDTQRIRSRSFHMLAGPVSAVALAEIVAYISFLIYPGRDDSFLGWRIYAFGMAGLIVGALIQRKRMPADDITLAVFTFFTVFIIYGGIMNAGAMFMSAVSAADISWEALRLLYITGVPFDLWHAVRASIFVFVFGNRILIKLERVKIKYGFYRIKTQK